jgi:hypothetical protein
MTKQSPGRICVATLELAACSLGAASVAEQEFSSWQMVVLDLKTGHHRYWFSLLWGKRARGQRQSGM